MYLLDFVLGSSKESSTVHSPGLILNLIASLQVGASSCLAPLAGKVNSGYLFTLPVYVADFNVFGNEWMVRRTVNWRGPAE